MKWNKRCCKRALCYSVIFSSNRVNDHMFMLFNCSTEEKWHVTLEILNDSRDVLFAQIKWNEMLHKRDTLQFIWHDWENYQEFILFIFSYKKALWIAKKVRVLTNCEPASQWVMRVEPASHASHHVNHARQMLVPSPFSFLQVLAAFGYLAQVSAINKRGW